MNERTPETKIHGRFLAIAAETADPAPILAGFHGYAEDAETQLARLIAIPGSERWLKVSVQGLHRFYQRRTSQVVAGWMTRQNRDLAIADNLGYVRACVELAAEEWGAASRVVFAGFSQGVAMAFRAAVHSERKVSGVIAVGGDVPPELSAGELGRIPAVLLARGTSDPLYTPEQFGKDEQRLRDCGVAVQALEFSAGHEWSAEVGAAASGFLGRIMAGGD